jgi:HK97 family phage portal protein
VFEWLNKLLKKSKTHSAILASMLGGPVWSTVNYQGYAKEGYEANTYVYACIRQIALAASGIPWYVYRKARNGELEELEGHELSVLFTRPNPLQGWGSFLENVTSYLQLSGNAYIEAVGPKKGKPKELYTLRPDRMQVIPGNKIGMISGYVYEVNGKRVAFDPSEILHLKLFNPTNEWYGMPPIKAAARSVDHNNEGRSWNVALLQNRAMPSGALSTKDDLTEEQFSRLKKQVETQYSGAQNAGRPLVLEGGLSWQSMALSPTDMDWLQGLKLSSREICSVFGVPPELIGDHENATYSNYQEARKAFYQETVLPTMDWIRDEFNNWLIPKFDENIIVDYDTENVEALAEDRDAVWTRVTNAVKTGVLTPNEARRELGYDDIQGGDILFMPGSMVPVVGGMGIDNDEE